MRTTSFSLRETPAVPAGGTYVKLIYGDRSAVRVQVPFVRMNRFMFLKSDRRPPGWGLTASPGTN